MTWCLLHDSGQLNLWCVNRPVWLPLAVRNLLTWYVTLLVVAAGVWFGVDYLPRREYNDFPGFLIWQPETSFLNGFATWDGVWYADIAGKGYQYDPGEGSHVVFFPLYPVCGWLVSQVTGWDVVLSLVVVSQVVFLADLWVLGAYARDRSASGDDTLVEQSLFALAILPGTFWFRMAYSDGLFLLFVLLFLLGIRRGWSLWWLALFSAGATGTRTVGVVLAAVWAFEVWRRQAERHGGRWKLATLLRTVGWGLLAGPMAIGGLLGFMVHLWWVFGDPLLFHSNQSLFNDAARMAVPWPRRLFDLATLESLWSILVPGTNRYWMTHETVDNPLFTLRFMNVPYFAASAVLLLIGWWRNWLNRTELWVGGLLLAIPYVTKGYDNAMLGHARYAAVAAPVYLVAGHLLTALPPLARQLLGALSACLLAFYSALFAAWFIFI